MQHAWICLRTPFKCLYDRFGSRDWLAQAWGLGPTCLFAHSEISFTCVWWRKRKFVETFLVITILLTCCQYRSKSQRNIIVFLWVLVKCLLYSRHVRFTQKEQIHIHKVVAEQVEEEDLVAYKIPLRRYCSKFNNTDNVWPWGRSWWFPNSFNREYWWIGRTFGWCRSRGLNRAMDTCQWNHDEHSTTLWWVNFLVQVWGADWWFAGSYSAWSRKTRTNTEKQTCGRCGNVPGTPWPRSSDITRWSQVFQGYVETKIRQRTSDCFPLEIFPIFTIKKRKHGDGQVDRQVHTAPGAPKKRLDGYVAHICHEPGTKRDPVPCWRGSAEWTKTGARSYCSDPTSQATRDHWHQTQVANNERSIPIQRQFDNIDVHCCKWSQWSTERTTYKHTFSPRNECPCLCSWSSENCDMELFCTPKSSMLKPLLSEQVDTAAVWAGPSSSKITLKTNLDNGAQTK